MKFTKLQWWLPKLLCLIAAFAFWVYVINEQNPIVEETFQVPIEVHNLDRSLVATNLPKTVKVKVKLNRKEMINLRSDKIKAYIDLQGFSNGVYQHIPVHASVPGSDPAVSISPEYIDVEIDTYAVKTLPITVEFFGKSPQNFGVKLDKVTPEYITVAGSSTSVAKADRAVVSVKIDGKKKDFSEYDSINVLDQSGSTVTGIDIMPTQVKVNVKVMEAAKTEMLNVKPQVIGTPMKGYHVGRISIDTPVVSVRGPYSLFDEKSSLSTESVDVSGATEDVTRTVSIETPDDTTVSPSTVNVTVEIKKE